VRRTAFWLRMTPAHARHAWACNRHMSCFFRVRQNATHGEQAIEDMDKSQTEARSEARADGFTPASGGRTDDVSSERVERLRTVVQRCLDGNEEVDDEVERLAASIAGAARADGLAPERLLIGVRALWRELGLSQGDRLQVSSVYDTLVRSCIERYYSASDGDGAAAPGSTC
jgi:hypothetical protein